MSHVDLLLLREKCLRYMRLYKLWDGAISGWSPSVLYTLLARTALVDPSRVRADDVREALRALCHDGDIIEVLRVGEPPYELVLYQPTQLRT